MSEQPTPAYAPLHNPATDDSGYTPTVEIALAVARTCLGEVAATNIHDDNAMVKAAVRLDHRLRSLVAALDAERAVTA